MLKHFSNAKILSRLIENITLHQNFLAKLYLIRVPSPPEYLYIKTFGWINVACVLLQDRGFKGKERDVTSTVVWTGLSPDVY
jgi:hypothetical protein